MGVALALVFRLAWRDSRTQRARLILCALSMVFGVAAMVAIHAFGHNLAATVDREAQTLLGADLQISSRTPFSAEAEAYLERLGGQQSREIRFSSMAYFPRSGGSRLVQVRALEGDFPYHGELLTQPRGLHPGRSEEPEVILDPLLMAQFDLEAGDQVRLGELTLRVAGAIERVPGESAFAGLFAPRLYLPMRVLESTGLIGFGSIAFYRATFYFPDGFDYARLQTDADFLADQRLRYETVASRKEDLGQALGNLYRYLGLVGLVALLLGGVGIGGAVQVYLRGKVETVAVLRCLGAPARLAFAVFLVQILVVALFGSLLGVLVGVVVQTILPTALGGLLPFTVETFVSWPSVLLGLVMGSGMALAFALFPLLPLRRIPPLRALRSAFDSHTGDRDPLIWPLGAFLLLCLLLYCIWQSAVWWHGVVFTGGLLLCLGLLAGLGWTLKTILRRMPKPRNYLWRQGLANLHRPRNRTVFLVVMLGLGVFLIQALHLAEHGILQETRLPDADEEPNLLIFDLQEDQKEGMASILEGFGMEVMEIAPAVTMRLASIRGRPVAEIRRDPEQSIDEWILNREWRSSYRSEPGVSERVVAGDYVGKWDFDRQPIPISLEVEMAVDLGVTLGDRLSFDLQGIPVEVTVSSLREVNWRQLRPNFFVTFPTGVLEEAPTWWIAVTRSPDTDTTAALQRSLFAAYPNLSVVDLAVVMDGLRNIFGRIHFAVQFMGLFTVATGLVVMVTTLLTSRYQRIREAALLRVVGASGGQVRAIMAIEYLVLGLVAGTVGVGLALITATLLSFYYFDTAPHLPWLQSLVVVLLVGGLTLLLGLANSRGLTNHPPLEILRGEP